MLPGARRRRGFSMVEAVVVVALVGLLSSAAVVWFNSSSRPDIDAAARASLASFSELQAQARAEGSAPLNAERLTERDYTRVFAEPASNGPQQVSVLVSGSVAMAAVASSTDGSCWMVRVDFAPSPTSPPELWYVDDSAPVCAAAGVNLLPVPLDGSGSTRDRPIVVS